MSQPTDKRRSASIRRLLPLVILALAACGVFAAAFGQLGVSSSTARTQQEVVTAEKGLVQSTVTGTGNVAPVTDEDVNFAASGTLKHVYVKTGEYVKKGQLLATLDRTSAALTLEQARATLATARATLVTDEASESTSTATEATEQTVYAAYTPERTTASATTTTTTAATPTTTTTATPTTTVTTPATTTTATTPATSAGSSSSGSSGGSASSGSSGTTTTTSAGTIDADELAIDTDEQTVKTDETALAQTRLRAPVAGTITTLESLSPGDTVSSGSDSSTASSDTSSSGTSGTSTSSSGSLGTSSSSTTSSTTSEFAEIVSLHTLSMTVAFDESDISKVKVGQSATVTLDALTGVELAAKVTAVSSIGTTSSSVVSYGATLTLQQRDARVKPGMSASASVIVAQKQGVTVPTDAVTGTGTLGTVTEQSNGKSVSEQVIVGLRGDSRILIASGLKAGAQLVVKTTLPSESSSAASTSKSSSSGTLGGSTGGTGAATGGGGFAGGGAPGGGTGGPP